MGFFINESGNKYGRLVVLERDFEHGQPPNSRPKTFWKCACECGSIITVSASGLRSGNTKSCGCYQKEITKKRATTHGKSREKDGKITPEFNAWVGMKTRCYNENAKPYDRYGGRGIEVCDRWLNDFELFFEDMGSRPTEHHSIDRINVNGNYEPENCRWATDTTQARNRRVLKNNKTGFSGVNWNKQSEKYEANITVDKKRIYLGKYKNLDDAINARLEAERSYWK